MIKMFMRFPKIIRWVCWGILYVFVFYLGNLSGEYVAARMPITSYTFPHIASLSLPKVSISWNGWQSLRGKMGTMSQPEASNTKLVVIAGHVFNMPTESATAQEKEEFAASVEDLAVAAESLKIAAACELNPAFIEISKDASLDVQNDSQESHTVALRNRENQSVAPAQMASFPIIDSSGVYPIACDGAIAGFYIVKE